MGLIEQTVIGATKGGISGTQKSLSVKFFNVPYSEFVANFGQHVTRPVLIRFGTFCPLHS
jgi:hypothetical protein